MMTGWNWDAFVKLDAWLFSHVEASHWDELIAEQ
jgi:hypothetical protein